MDISKTPLSLEELSKFRKPLRNINIELKEGLTPLNRAALWITQAIGTMGFFMIITSWTVLWLAWNTFGPIAWRIDPYPGFVLWLIASNMLQILLIPLIMIGQNLQHIHAEARAEADFEINTKAELEIESVLQHLEYQNQLMLQILERLEAREKRHDEMAGL